MQLSPLLWYSTSTHWLLPGERSGSEVTPSPPVGGVFLCRSAPTLNSVKRLRGVTVLELLLAIAILGILVAIAAPMLQPPAASLFANDLRITIQQARHEAIRRNRPVAVVWTMANQSFTTRVNEVSPRLEDACAGPTVLRTRSAVTYPRLTVTSDFGDGQGIVWLPNGQARRCDGAALGSVSTQISDGRTTRTVTTNMTGMVTIE